MARITLDHPLALPSAAVPEWMDDDRISCRDCAWRNGWICNVRRTTHVPVEIKHYCDDYRRSNGPR